ncbi:MAG: zf-HC2 domain-containing protein [Gammaproteobacteria bacterium]|nr:MAG: zf-HC2 domain-containing protein [Gammaproteobacteria bacterium]
MLNFKLLTCQEVATVASDYLDKHIDGKLGLNIRLHLMMCANCRRFVKHLQLTTKVVPHLVYKNQGTVDAEAVLKRIKEKR